jgi:ribonucleotide monophosphatase NagD (HAD superfamily)
VVPGGGALVAALTAGAGRVPDVVAGKPSAALVDLIEAGTGIARARAVMVGDRLDTDILFGNANGLASSLLVLTGVTAEADLAKLPEGDARMPRAVAATLADLGPWVRALLAERAGGSA